MKRAIRNTGIAVGMVALFLLPSFSFATAEHQCTSFSFLQTNGGLNNGTVTLAIGSGKLNKETGEIKGIIGYTILVDNLKGTQPVNYTVNETYYIPLRKAYLYATTQSIVYPEWAHSFRVFNFLYPPLFLIRVEIRTNTSTNLSLMRSGFVLFSFFVVFTTGQPSITGPS
jgi:hypothetical protein